MKPAKTNQCITPIHVHCSIRVWPSVSLNIVASRRPRWSLRVPSGWPVRMTPSIERTAVTASPTAMAVMASETTIAMICMRWSSSVRRVRRAVVRTSGERSAAACPERAASRVRPESYLPVTSPGEVSVLTRRFQRTARRVRRLLPSGGSVVGEPWAVTCEG